MDKIKNIFVANIADKENKMSEKTAKGLSRRDLDTLKNMAPNYLRALKCRLNLISRRVT